MDVEKIENFQKILNKVFPDMHLEANVAYQHPDIVTVCIDYVEPVYFASKELNEYVARKRILEGLKEMRSALRIQIEKIKETENDGLSTKNRKSCN